MQEIGTSSLFVEKYRPKCIDDLILPKNYRDLFEKIVKEKELPNLLLSGSAGLGKSSLCYALANELDCDLLFINASLETGIDILRSKVLQFASTSSFRDGKKLVVLDEADRISANAADSIKGIIELTEANCRFILTTNNLSKIIDPIKSRTQLIDFSFVQSNQKEIIVQYFKRCQFILDNEKIKYDKKVLADFIQKVYPDFRKIINELQKAAKMFGEINESVFKITDDAMTTDLIKELKAKKFLNVQTIASNMDADSFYKEFYDQMNDQLDLKCIPDIVLILAEYSYKSANCIDKTINLLACCIEIMKTAIWR